MTVYEKLHRRAAVFRNLTGLSMGEFAVLYHQVVDAMERYDEARQGRRDRQRVVGAGRRDEQDAGNRLVMVLIVLRLKNWTLLGQVIREGSTGPTPPPQILPV